MYIYIILKMSQILTSLSQNKTFYLLFFFQDDEIKELNEMLTEAGETFQAKEKEIADLKQKLTEDAKNNEEEVGSSLTTAGTYSDSVLRTYICRSLWVYGYPYEGRMDYGFV